MSEAILAVMALWMLASLVKLLLLRLFGWRVVYVTGLVGVPIHELSHALVATLSGMQIQSIRLFSPDRRTGQLGSVSYVWNRNSMLHRVMIPVISIAPLFGAAVVIHAVLQSGPLHPEESLLGAYIITSTSLHGFPSWVDIREGLPVSVVLSLLFIALILLK